MTETENLNIADQETFQEISLGKMLRERREDLKIEISNISTHLRIKAADIEAIENDATEVLTQKRLYAPGLIRSYAKFLKIDDKIIEEKINALSFQSNVENKKHLLLNIGEDPNLSPSKDDFFGFLLISILLFLVLLSIYSSYESKDSLITSQELISKLGNIDGR